MRLRPDEPEKSLRTKLGGAGFHHDIVDMAVEKLSGGQKARLLMLIATIDAPHILILDEPTNHLDIESREALVMALNDYDGAVILVSHDTHLVETVADRLWLVKDGTVTSFEGDMNDYKKLILQNAKMQKPAKNKTNTDKKSPKQEQKKRTNPVKLKHQAKELETQIETLQKQRDSLEAQMASPDFYSAHDGGEIAQISNQLSDIIDNLARAEDQWLEVLAELDED